MKSISIKTDDDTFNKLQLITFKASTDQKQKVYMKDVILESINNFVFKKYADYLTVKDEEIQPETKVTRGKKTKKV